MDPNSTVLTGRARCLRSTSANFTGTANLQRVLRVLTRPCHQREEMIRLTYTVLRVRSQEGR